VRSAPQSWVVQNKNDEQKGRLTRESPAQPPFQRVTERPAVNPPTLMEESEQRPFVLTGTEQYDFASLAEG
jgi:hypothetical protein